MLGCLGGECKQFFLRHGCFYFRLARYTYCSLRPEVDKTCSNISYNWYAAAKYWLQDHSTEPFLKFYMWHEPPPPPPAHMQCPPMALSSLSAQIIWQQVKSHSWCFMSPYPSFYHCRQLPEVDLNHMVLLKMTTYWQKISIITRWR